MPLQKIPKENIMAAIAKIGPSQPIDIRKELREGDSFLIGAMLSELVGEGKLAITKVRRGGSPFYYDVEKPESLDAASRWLNEKDRRTYELLKEQKVMREDAQEPLVRVGLKNMPDFSKPLEVDGAMYWKHYLISDDEAARIIKGIAPAQATENPAQRTVPQEIVTAIVPEAQPAAPVQERAVKAERPKRSKGKKAEGQTTLASTKAASEAIAERIDDAKEAGSKPKKAKRKTADPVMMPDGAVMISPQEWLAHDTLYEKVQRFAGEAKLRDARVHKPHSELTCIMTISTQFGPIDTFVHAFNKKFTPDDVKANLPRARELGLPILVLSADAIPSKVTAQFKGMPNIIFRRFE